MERGAETLFLFVELESFYDRTKPIKPMIAIKTAARKQKHQRQNPVPAVAVRSCYALRIAFSTKHNMPLASVSDGKPLVI
jgi:hypothetical protein